MDARSIERWRPALVIGWHILGVLLIAWLFLIILMAAAAQSHVVQRLAVPTRVAAEGIAPQPLDFSAGYAMWQQSLALDAEIARLRRQLAARLQRREALAEQFDLQQDDFVVRVARLQSLRLRLTDYPFCRFGEPQLGPLRVAEAIGALKICLATVDTLPPALAGEIRATLTEADPLLKAATGAMRSDRQLARLNQAILDTGGEIKARRAERVPLAAATDAFGELDVLKSNALLGGALLVSFPPSMIQILLAFAAGLFGALLVTLVLIVYPNNELRFTSTKASLEERVLLGGLVSICVFVVLGGGTAVLGTSNAFTGGNVNFLAFCGIGILAGMFSDRVAYWLSDRAKNLFKDEDDAARKATDAAAASESAKQAADLAAAANADAARAAAARAAEAAGDEAPAGAPA